MTKIRIWVVGAFALCVMPLSGCRSTESKMQAMREAQKLAMPIEALKEPAQTPIRNHPFKRVSVPKNFYELAGLDPKEGRPSLAFITPTGKTVVVAAVASSPTHDQLKIARFENGQLDTTFGDGGFAQVSQPAGYLARVFKLHRSSEKVLILGTSEKRQATGVIFLLSMNREGELKAEGKPFQVVKRLTNIAGSLRGVYRPKITSVALASDHMAIQVKEDRPREDLGNNFEARIPL